MKPVPLILFASLLLLWVVAPGCDDSSDPAAAQGSAPAQTDQTADDQPPAEPASQSPITPTGTTTPQASARVAPSLEEAPAASAYIVIQNAGPRDPQQLVRQLQQVLPLTQVVKQVQSPNPREIKLEVTNIKDVRALANKIPFGSVEAVNDRARTITVDFDL